MKNQIGIFISLNSLGIPVVVATCWVDTENKTVFAVSKDFDVFADNYVLFNGEKHRVFGAETDDEDYKKGDFILL